MSFPVPGDAIEQSLDLNQHLITNPPATFFMRAEGNSIVDSDVQPGDLLIVDRSLSPGNDRLVVAVINGELVIVRVQLEDGQLKLHPIAEDVAFEIWGVITHIIRAV
jgi:DNA polymerase V